MALVRKTFHAALLFCVVFSFRIPIIYNSTLLAGLIACIYLFFSPQLFQNVICFFRSRYVINIFVFLISLFMISAIIPTLHRTFEFSLLRVYLGLGATFVCVLLVAGAIHRPEHTKDYVLRLIFLIFSIQSLIQLASYIFPEVLTFVRLFQAPKAVEVAERTLYFGIRGLSLSGNLFFSLAAAVGIVYMFHVKYIADKGTLYVEDIVQSLLLFISGLFVGRTFLFGVLFGLIYFLGCSTRLKKLRGFFKLAAVSGVFLLLLWWSFPDAIKEKTTERFFPFAFEVFYSLFNTKVVKSSSTDILLESFKNTDLSLRNGVKTFFIGDGRYTNQDASYYMHVDIGYLRHFFYGGIVFMLLFFFLQLSFFISSEKILFYQQRDRNNYVFFICLTLGYLLLLHVKGEILGTSKYVQVILFVCGLQITIQNKEKLL